MYKKIILTAVTYFLSLGIYQTAKAQSFQQSFKVVANDRQETDQFGEALAISGNIAVVGAPFEDHDLTGTSSSLFNNGYTSESGSAYIYEKNDKGEWIFKQKLIANDRQTDDLFGISVAISGNVIIIGAVNESHNALGTVGSTTTSHGFKVHAGAAYVFEKNASGNWYQSQKIVANDRDIDDKFGRDVAVSGNTILVSADGETNITNVPDFFGGTGAVYVFEKNSSGVWTQQQKLTSSDAQGGDLFGSSIAISGSYCAIGAPLEDHNEYASAFATVNTADFKASAGAVYIFKKLANGNWQQEQKIVASDRQAGDLFGQDVDIFNKDIIVGVAEEDHNMNGTASSTTSTHGYASEAGAAYIFEANSVGIWSQKNKLVAPDRQAGDYFGNSVAISNNIAVIGARNEAHNLLGTSTSTTNHGFAEQSGSAYIFKRVANANWSYAEKIIANDKQELDQFGCTVSISGNNLLIGAKWESHDQTGTTLSTSNSNGHTPDAGSVYFYTQCIVQNITASSAGPIVAGDTVSLNASIDKKGNYNVTSIPYNAITLPSSSAALCNNGTALSALSWGTLDDGVWNNIPIPFAFKFYDTTYNTISVSTNGLLSFNPFPNSISGCCNGQAIPDASYINAYIGVGHNDLNASASGLIAYTTLGSAPNRQFIIRFANVPFHNAQSSSSVVYNTIVLNESDNSIEMHINQIKAEEGKLTTVGIESPDGMQASVIADRNKRDYWIAQDEGWKFTPPTIEYNWSPSSSLLFNTLDSIQATPTATTTYTVVTNNLNGCSNYFATTTVEVTFPSNITDYANNNIYSVYPNPTSADVYVEWEGKKNSFCSIEVLDMNGRIILDKKIKVLVGPNKVVIPTSTLANGIYLLQIMDNNQRKFEGKIRKN